MFEKDRNRTEAVWQKLKVHTGLDDVDQMQARGLDELNRWQVKDPTKSGRPYVAFDLDDYHQIKAISDRKDKLTKSMVSADYFGSDASKIWTKRAQVHNSDINFSPGLFDHHTKIGRLRNRRIAIIYGGICTSKAAFKAYESMAIHVSRTLNLGIKNVLEGEQFDSHITGYDTAEFGCAFVAMLLEMLENPIAVAITTAQQIEETQSIMQTAERIGIVDPFIRFMTALLNRLPLQVQNLHSLGYSELQTTTFLKQLINHDIVEIVEGTIIKVTNYDDKCSLLQTYTIQ